MLTCIVCSKHQHRKGHPAGARPLHDDPDDDPDADAAATATPSSRLAIKSLTMQIKDMAVKASGAYRHCKPCSGGSGEAAAASRRHHPYAFTDSEASRSGSERFHYRRADEYDAGGKSPVEGSQQLVLDSGENTPSVSAREESDEAREDGDEEEDGKEWVAQVEPGVLITFLALPHGNDLKRIRFSRDLFNKWQAQRWWSENYDKVMELYNVQRFNQQTAAVPSTLRSEDESSKDESPVTPPLSQERLPRTLRRPPTVGGAVGYSSSDSFEHHSSQYTNGHHLHRHHGHRCCDPMALASTPKLSSISGAKTETSSVDASMRSSYSQEEVDRSGELSVSISNASDQEREWIEEDEPGVYITIRALPGGVRELRRVRFSRERFSEMHARIWWEENRARIHEQYL